MPPRVLDFYQQLAYTGGDLVFFESNVHFQYCSILEIYIRKIKSLLGIKTMRIKFDKHLYAEDGDKMVFTCLNFTISDSVGFFTDNFWKI